jgi:alpha-L-rhamnosidase
LNPFLPPFQTPEPEHTACPFWFWNGDLEPAEIVRQIGLMFDKGIRSFVIHARVGLTVPYLSETWFERCELAITEAAQRGMKVWLYDEDNWPSGYAGGRVLASNSDFVAQHLALEQHYLEDGETLRLTLEYPEQVRAVLACRIAQVEPLPANPLDFQRSAEAPASWTDTTRFTHQYAEEPALPLEPQADQLEWNSGAGRWCVMVFRQRPTNWLAAYSDQPYVDLLNAGATSAFIEETHELYWQRFALHFGSTILGFFVDEPGFYNNFWTTDVGTLTWTHNLPLEFERRRGYSLLPCLPSLWETVGEHHVRVRLDYWKTIAELLEERFFGMLSGWCEAHGVMLTGHLHYEEWLFTMTRNSVSPFSALKSFQVPGVDKIDEVTDKIVEKLIASVAHVHSRPRVLSETFALTGWKLAPPYMKQILDYQFVRGMNWISFHGFYYSIDEHRRFDCPPSEFFQNPWWDHSGPMWDYVARLSAVLSQGQHVAPVALYYPSEQAQATMTPFVPGPMPKTNAWETWQLPQPEVPVQRSDLSMIHSGLHLLETQWDFDLLDHAALETGTVKGGRLTVANESFRIVVLPALDAIHATTLRQLFALAQTGGTVIFVNRLPETILAGIAPAEWKDLREQLSSLTLPAFIQVGLGNIGFVPKGIESLAPLLETIERPDVHLEIDASDDRWLSTLENRNGMFRDARIKPLRHAIKYHRRHCDGYDLYFVTNESGESFRANLELHGGGQVELWNPKTGVQSAMHSEASGSDRVRLKLAFGPWQSYLLALEPALPNAPIAPKHEVRRLQISDWQLELAGQMFESPLRSWAALGRSSFSGVGLYTTTFEWTETGNQSVWLDLGVVLETAKITLNGVNFAPLVWGPYRVDVSVCLRVGINELRIEVANTNANAFEGRERPSGLLGPVWIVSSDGLMANTSSNTTS